MEAAAFFCLFCHKARLVSFHCATSRTVLGLGVGLPGPQGVPAETSKAAQGYIAPTPLEATHTAPEFPIDYFGGNRYNGRWAQIKICCVGLGLKVASCIGTWGGGALHVLPFASEVSLRLFYNGARKNAIAFLLPKGSYCHCRPRRCTGWREGWNIYIKGRRRASGHSTNHKHTSAPFGRWGSDIHHGCAPPRVHAEDVAPHNRRGTVHLNSHGHTPRFAMLFPQSSTDKGFRSTHILHI